MHGWTGKILRIDLTTLKHDIETPREDVFRDFIGGKGMAGYYLAKHVSREWDDSKMPLLFFTGPLVGTAAPTSGRMTVMSKSPLTGTVGDASVGGKFGTELKKAGWDGIIITGKSKGLIGVEISDENIRFVDASQLKGFSISTVTSRISPDKGAIATIGPAAENGVLFANIVFDGHFTAGRNGLGLVCAAKNIKYITVKGSQKVGIHDSGALAAARKDILRLVSASPVLMGELGITHFGTGALYDLTHSRHMMPTDNFRKTFFANAGQLNAHAYHQKYHPK